MSLKSRVVNFYNKNINLGNALLLSIFLMKKIPKSIVYRLISCAEQGDNYEEKKGSGRPSKKLQLNQT